MVRSEGWAQSTPDAPPSHADAPTRPSEPSRKRLCPSPVYLTVYPAYPPPLHATSPSGRILGER